MSKVEERRQQLLAEASEIVARWGVRLGLTAWSIEISIVQDDEESAAMWTRWAPGYRTANITINEILLDTRPSHIEPMLVHELTHMLCAPMEDWLSANLKSEGVMYLDLQSRMETITDMVATLFRRLYAVHPE